MHPYRHRSLPSKHARGEPKEKTSKSTPVTESKPAAPQSFDMNTLMLLASMMQPSMQQDIQKLLPYLSEHSQSVADVAVNATTGVQSPEDDRIHAAIAQQQGMQNAKAASSLQALKSSNASKQVQPQAMQVDSSTENEQPSIESLMRMLMQNGQGGQSSIPSQGIQSGNPLMSMITGQGGNPLMSMLMPMLMQSGQSFQASVPSSNIQSGNPLMPVLQGSQGGNPLMSMLMQGNQGGNPMMSMLMQGGQGGNPMMSMLLPMLMQGGQEGNPMMSMLMPMLMQGASKKNR